MIRCNHAWNRLSRVAVFAGLLAAPGAGRAETFSLEYRTNRHSASFTLPLRDTEIRFEKEPVYAGSQVARSVLYVASGKKEYVGFACDLEGKKLYVDLNRNRDLTDDPAGVFGSSSDGWGLEFENVVLPVQQGDRRREMVLGFQFYGESWGRYSVQSSWEGEGIALGEKTWRVAVLDNGDGAIDRSDTLYLESMGAEDGQKDLDWPVEVNAPATLTLDGEPFALAYELAEDGKTLEVSVEPGTPRLLEVELKGEGIERLVLQDPKSVAVFFHPSSVIRLPAGRYRGEVRVRSGEGTNALLWEARGASLHVQGDQERKSWAVGGPVVSKLTCRKSGNQLVFDQAAKGAGGETYRLASASGGALGKPKLRVKKGGDVVHVGEFEYG